MNRSKTGKFTAKELKFVANWTGSPTAAARAAGYKHPEKVGTRIAARQHVKDAIEEKEKQTIAASVVSQVEEVTVTRNEVINKLADLMRTAKSENAQVSAAGILTDIFGLRLRNGKNTDPFAGWTDDQLEYYRRTGNIPPGVGQAAGYGAGDGESAPPATAS